MRWISAAIAGGCPACQSMRGGPSAAMAIERAPGPWRTRGSGSRWFLAAIAHDGLGLAAPRDDRRLLEHALAKQDDAAIALAQMLLRAIGDGPLPDPGHEVLVHDVAGDASGRSADP